MEIKGTKNEASECSRVKKKKERQAGRHSVNKRSIEDVRENFNKVRGFY